MHYLKTVESFLIIGSLVAVCTLPACGDDSEESKDCADGSCLPGCGNGSCDGAESCDTCPADCGACSADCGDEVCGSDEDCTTCPSDCGPCPQCGDFACGADEICAPCEDDDPCTQTQCSLGQECLTESLPAAYECGTTSTSAGWDFSLPNPSPEPFAGLWARTTGGQGGVLVHGGVTPRWRDLNPTEGNYNWSSLDGALADASLGGFKVIIRLMTNNWQVDGSPNAVPPWVMSACNISGTATVAVGKPYSIVVPPLWNTCLQGHYQSFIEAFFDQQFLSRPEVGGIYLTGISDSRGEEMNLVTKADVQSLENIGMTPAVLEATFKTRFDLWATGAGSFAWKVAWVGGTTYASSDDYSYGNTLQAINEYAYQLGFGSRGGFLESSFIGQIDKYTMATGDMDGDGHYTIDETHPIHQSVQPRYLGDEIENISTVHQERWPHSIRVLLLRALQMRMNWLWADDDFEVGGPEGEIAAVANYFNQVAGKRADNSPDAWALLRSTLTSKYSCTEEARNFHRWLSQVEVAGSSATQSAPSPTLRIENGGHECPGFEGQDWNRVLADDGSSKMDFRIDRDWLPETQLRPVKLLVTQRANGSSFQVNYCSPNQVSSSVVTAGEGGDMETVVLSLGQVASTQCRTHDVDLEIEPTSGSPEIAFVRLVRLN